MTDRPNDNQSSSSPHLSDTGVAEEPIVSEYRAPHVYGTKELTRTQRALRRVRDQALLSFFLGLGLFPILAVAALTPDMPIDWFDGAVEAASLRPSSWMTVADAWFTIAFFVMLFMARRYGAETVAQGQAVAWFILLGASFGLIVAIAPQLTADDLPRGAYVLGASVSWYLGPLVGIFVFDLTRGKMWWRAPLYAGLAGMFVQTLMFFPIAFGGTAVPWGKWWMMDLIIKVLSVVPFVGAYAALRKRLLPLPNLGGR